MQPADSRPAGAQSALAFPGKSSTESRLRGPRPGGTEGAYFSLKLWQSVHSTMVGLVSWVPTWMVDRPQ